MRLKSHVFALLVLLGAVAVPATSVSQTPTPIPITGNLGSISGTPQAYSGVLIQLVNCPTPASVTGFYGIVQTAYQIQANSAGLVNATIWPNDLITCNGTTGSSQYSLMFLVNGIPSGTAQCYQVTSTQGIWSLNGQQAPIACGQSPPNPQDASYRNLTLSGFFQGNNGSFSGQLQLGSILLGTAAQNCSSGQWMSGLTTALVPVCSVLPVNVSSFNGRTGAVVPASGDYSYSQITGTPTIYYQTVQENGTPLAQQPVLNCDGTVACTAGTGKTNVGLPSTGTAGTYAYPASVTVDPQGRVTGVTAGTSTSTDQWGTLAGCAFANDGGGLNCTAGTITWPSPFADTSYIVGCWPMYAMGNVGSASVQAVIDLNATINTAAQITLTEGVAQGSSGGWGVSASYGLTIICHAHHP